jgi:short-subunit dehydrogenase
MSYEWKDRVVLITGASSGIGRALAVELGRRGARLGLVARREGELLQTAEAVIEAAAGAGGVRPWVLPADVRDAAQMQKAAESLRAACGRVDVLVANAGMTSTTGATHLRAAEAGDVITVNVIGVVNSVAAVLPVMLEQKSGHLVAISSLAAYRGMPKSGAYSASKAAVSTFFESLRLDLRRSNIDVTVIHPGFIRTPLTAGRKMKLPYLLEVDDAARRIDRKSTRLNSSHNR